MLHIDRTPGVTFALADIGWLDFETRCSLDLKNVGTYRYAGEADAIVCAYAIGDGPPIALTSPYPGRPMSWEDMPAAFRNHHVRVQLGQAVWAAWNAGFDKAIWNHALDGLPPRLEPHQIIDVMVQATASGLAPDLMMAAKQSHSLFKLDTGKKLIELFCSGKSTATTPKNHPHEWAKFLSYACGDIASMRSVFLGTRQLPRAEWREYWAMERINERGVSIDLEMVSHAAKLAVEDRKRSGELLAEITNGDITTVDQTLRMVRWLTAVLPPEGVKELTKRAEELDEDGAVVEPAKHSITRSQVQRLIAFCQEWDDMRRDDVLRLLQIRLYGGSKTPAKFVRMQQQHVDGVLLGQYVFNGAAQTGRASSKGVQIHNLARDFLPYELDAADAVIGKCTHAQLACLGDDSPVARKLSLLIRPSFVPSPDRVFVWSDWSQIEARIVPWLTDHRPEARARLQSFRDCDADPNLPDLYTRTAAAIFHLPIEMVTKPIRQRGKVAELALGFCGGVNALQNMAAGYGIHLADDDAKQIVERWRQVNHWALEYSQEIWNAVMCAMDYPDRSFAVGRINLRFRPRYLDGSLWCVLPSGRMLTYRMLRWEMLDVKDDSGKVIGKSRELTFARGHGRVKLWPGLFVENFTQAVAADVLRGTLVRLEAEGLATRLHTHDECVVECDSEVGATSERLRWIMQQGFSWSNGLPLMSEETCGYFYTKNEEGQGL